MSEPTVQDNSPRLVTLVRGVMEQGGFYWCYVAIKPELADKFQKAIANKYNIQNFVKDAYGEIVVSGKGKQPPAEVTQKVEELFGVTIEEVKDANIGDIFAKAISASKPSSGE